MKRHTEQQQESECNHNLTRGRGMTQRLICVKIFRSFL